MKKLDSVTLLGIDCVDIDRLILAADICLKNFEFSEVKLLTSLPTSHPNIVSIPPIRSIEEYSRFAIADLDQYVTTPHVLVIQYDGFILNPDAWSDSFLEYDYIGAPWLVKDWSIEKFGFSPATKGQMLVGNGGFSLRSKKLTSELARMSKNGEFQNYHPEDVVISLHKRHQLEQNGIVFAPVPVAKRFSFEAEDDEKIKWDGQFGFHGLRWTDISLWLEKHPEYPIENPIKKK